MARCDLQRLQVREQRADPRAEEPRSISFRSATGSRPLVSGHSSAPKVCPVLALPGTVGVVLLDQNRVVGAVARPSAGRPIRSRPALRRSTGFRGGSAAGASPSTSAGPASEPTRCADTAPAPRCRAARPPCSRWCPPPRGAACRGSTRRAAPASRLSARTSRRPAAPGCSGRRCGRPSITSAASP